MRPKAVAHHRHIEIQKKSDAMAAQFEVRQQLCFMDRRDFFDSFQLNNNLISN